MAAWNWMDGSVTEPLQVAMGIVFRGGNTVCWPPGPFEFRHNNSVSFLTEFLIFCKIYLSPLKSKLLWGHTLWKMEASTFLFG